MASQDVSRDSERRQATVMFADISGFTAMSEKLDPEDVTLIMNRCFAMLERVVITHGGHVDKYIGDCIMALFGVPQAAENAPKQAVNAAIEIRNCLAQFNQDEKLPIPLNVHIGVNSGLVIAGDVGGQVKHDFTVMGDTVNLASRLEDASHAGQIYVGADTYHYTRDEFEYRQLKPLTLEGKKEPVIAYELLSAKEKVHRPKVGTTSRMIASDMIGRDRELAEIKGRMAQLTAGEGGIISLIGDAGLGKSRLLAEASAAEELKPALLLEGRSLSIGQSLSFHPFVDLLRHWAGVTDDEVESQALAKLESAVASVFGDATGEIFPFIATLMGMRLTGPHADRVAGIEGEALEKLILKSIRELFQTLAGAKPLVLVFEDLHWADLSSIKLLEALLRLSTDHRILFITVCRPDYPETGQKILQCARDTFPSRHLEIALQPLDDRQCDRLIRQLLKIDDPPYAIRELIRSKAEGSPFYIEEVIRSLIDEGVIEQEDGRLRVTEKIHTVVIPGTIQAVIMARVDRLDEASRHVLQVASVIGRSFYYRIVAAIMDNTDTLDGTLGYLKERQLLLERRSRRTATVRRVTLTEEVEYVFQHALIQEAIYESILQKTRKELHVKVARAIESIFADRLADFYGMLAYHYSRAEHLEKAEEYLFKAGDEAARAAASSEALHFFREASRLYFMMHGDGGDPNKKSLLAKNIGLALLNKGNLAESIDHFDQALTFLRGERVPRTRLGFGARFAADLAVLLGRLYLGRLSGTTRSTDREEFEIRYNRARAQTTSDPTRFVFDTIGTIRRMTETDPTAIDQAVGMFTAAAAVFVWSGLSFAIGKRFLAVAKNLVRQRNPRDEFGYRSWKFVLHYLEGDWSAEHVVPNGLVEHAVRRGQFWDVNTYLGLNCERLMHQGDFAGAQREIDRIAELANVFGYDFARSNEYAMPAFLRLEQRQFAGALEAVQRYYDDRQEPLLHLNALGIKAKIHVLAGDEGAALDTFKRAEALRRQLGPVPSYHQSMLLISRFLFDVLALEESIRTGDRKTQAALAPRARRSAKQAIRIANAVAREKVEVYRLTGQLWWVLGKPERAVRWWERSLREGERMGARPELARTYLEVGRRLRAAAQGHRLVGNLPAATYLEKAEQLFAELGLGWDLEQAANASGRSDATQKRTVAGASAA